MIQSTPLLSLFQVNNLMTKNFDKFFYSIIKESPDSIWINGKEIMYSGSDQHITGLMMQHDNTKFICTSKKNPAKIIGHSNFQNKLKKEFLSIESSIITNLSKDEINQLKKGSMMMHDKINSAIRFRIFNTEIPYYSFWGGLTKKKFDGAVAILKQLKIDPNSVKWDVSVTSLDSSHEYHHFWNKPKDTPKRPSKIEEDGDDYFTGYYTFKQLEDYFKGLDDNKHAEMEKEEERKRLEQAELEKQIKLKALGFSGRSKPYWQK
jgi:hypothetical protein